MPNSTLLYQIAKIRKLEELAIKQGISVDLLMQRAGKSACCELRKRWPKIKNITVVCGKGNNAGDGYVVAYFARQAKFKVKILQLVPDVELRGAAKRAALKCQKLKIKTEHFTPEGLKGSQLIVDAILGTGLVKEVSNKFQAAIAVINASNIPVLALDVPSGLDADTGMVLGQAIVASATITFIALKIGLFVGEARDHCGEIVSNDLALPPQLLSLVAPDAQKLNLAEELSPLLPRKRNSHKGNFGLVLVIGGDYGMGGAVRMAAEAALKVGAGLVTVATRHENVSTINAARPEIIAYGVDTEKDLRPLLGKASVVVIGPGLGTAPWGKSLFAAALAADDKPLVVDADGLNILAATTTRRVSANWILTPHPGEAAKLLGISNHQIQIDRLGAVQKINYTFGGVTVLKGAGTLIATAGARIRLCDAGNPGMATAGMGDILSGMIAGLLAEGLGGFDAAKLGVLVHALAGDAVTKKYGMLGILALDLLPEVRRILNGDKLLCSW